MVGPFLQRERFVSQLNIGNIDSAFRILVGLVLLVLLVLTGSGVIGVWAYIGIVLMVTGTIAICPLLQLAPCSNDVALTPRQSGPKVPPCSC